MKIDITAGGSYRLNGKHSMGSSIVYLSGDLGGATAVLTGFGGALVDGTVAIGTQYQVRHGRDADLFLVVSGGSPDFSVKVSGLE